MLAVGGAEPGMGSLRSLEQEHDMVLGTLTLYFSAAEVFDIFFSSLRVNYQLTAFENYFRHSKYSE